MEQTLTPIEGAATTAGADPTPSVWASLHELGPLRLMVLATVAVVLPGSFALLLLCVVEPDYTLLCTGLGLEDSAQIVCRVEAIGVPVCLQDGGAAILVAADRALRLRMALAEDGLPRGGTVGDEISDDASPLGTGSVMTDIDQRRAPEGELARSLGDVHDARIHLILSKREPFGREAIEPSVSVTLRMAVDRRLVARGEVVVDDRLGVTMTEIERTSG